MFPKSEKHAPARKIPHPPSTKYDEDDSAASWHDEQEPTPQTPSTKRRKTGGSYGISSARVVAASPRLLFQSPAPSPVSGTKEASRSARLDEIPDSEDEDLHTSSDNEVGSIKTRSQLETALPLVQTDAEAIEAYEAYKSAEAAKDDGDGGDDDDTLQGRLTNHKWTRGRSSIYVDAFNLALSTVLEDEQHLFNDAEKEVFQYWEKLSYEAQYLYVRLFLRKTSTWFRIGKLGYYGDIADMEAAVQELQDVRDLPHAPETVEHFPGEKTIPDEALPLGVSFVFAERSEDNITTLDEASSLLLLDELKTIAKDAKVNGKNKTELLRNLRRTSGKQRGLGFLKRSETENSVTSERSTPGPDVNDHEFQHEDAYEPNSTATSKGNRDDHFTKKILEQTGKCIRLALVPLKIFERVHLVFYRSTEWTEKSLTTLILAKISRKNFPQYFVSRSATIFESRSLLLEFEASLRTQFRVDSILEFNGTPNRRGLEEVKSIFEAVYPRWKLILAKEQMKEDRVYESGEGAYLRRFSPAWVYTRIVHKALAILAKFKEHLREHKLLCELLEQRLFHAARRGLWYSRKALLEEHYMYALTPSEGRSEETNKKHWKRIALNTCEEGLQDNECHVIYHYDLQKRIKKLEKQLRMPKREQHDFGHVGLLKARERTVEGIKIERDEPARPLLRRKSSTSSNGRRSVSHERSNAENDASSDFTPKRVSTKTIWHDELDTELPVSVEAMCLSHYRKNLHYKGYHSEGGILRALFGLLFYDIMFNIYVPNVFQTAYQTCPLDLHTDAFYSARISEINQLINRITNGEAQTMIRSTWTSHYEQRTCIVGVRWDDYELDDLVEIVNCWNGEALGTVMRVLAQEYGGRGGGVPDLFLWKVYDGSGRDHDHDHDPGLQPNDNTGHSAPDALHGDSETHKHNYGTIMFSEVKSENDRLSDTQRLWISVLLNAGVEVELCHAVAKEIIRQ